MDPVEAEIEIDRALVTGATSAVKLALFAVAGTITEAGTTTEPPLDTSATFTPPLGADPDNVTVHVSTSAPVIDTVLQEIPLTVGTDDIPAPLRLTVAACAVLEIASCPVDDAVVFGKK